MMDDIQPLDYTGYGYTSMGGAPNAADMRRQAIERFHSARVADAMRYLDPYTTQFARQAARMVNGGQGTASQIRNTVYGSAAGQAFLDVGMMLRQRDAMGYGNPVNYAHNIMHGITAGGFGVNVSGPSGLRGYNQTVTGNGVLAERASLAYQQGVIRSLYGNGTADPASLNGFTMEDASRIFSRVASRGGVGTVGHIIRGASVAERLAAARDSAVDPMIRDGLREFGNNRDMMARLNDADRRHRDGDKGAFMEISRQLKDPKLQKEIQAIGQSTDAFRIDAEAPRKFADFVKNLTKGMATLQNIYQEMNSDQLHQTLESLTGMRINDLHQSKRAGVMVGNLTNAAFASGMDPNQFLSMHSMRQAMSQSWVRGVMGTDDRSSSQEKEINASMSAHRSVMAVQLARQQQALEAAGGPRARTEAEIYKDIEQGQQVFSSQYRGIIDLRGAMPNLSAADRARADQISRDFSSATTAQERQILNQRALALVSGGDVQAYLKSGTAVENFRNGYTGQNAVLNENDRLGMRNQALNTGGLQAFLRGTAGHEFGLSAADANRAAGLITRNIGAGGMQSRLRSIANDKSLTAEDRKRLIRESLMGEAGMGGDDAEFFLGSFFGPDGTILKGAAFDTTVRLAAAADREGGSRFAQNAAAESLLAEEGRNDARTRLLKEDGLSLKGILKAVMSGGMTLGSDESMAALLDAYKKEHGVNLTVDAFDAEGNVMKDASGQVMKINMSDGLRSGIDISRGLTAGAIGHFRAAAGGNLDLAKALGFASEEELIAASSGPGGKQVLKRAVDVLKGTSGMTVGGAIDNMFAMNDNTRHALLNSDQFFKTPQQLAGARLLFPSLADGEMNTLTQSIIEGRKPDFGDLLLNPGDETGKEGFWSAGMRRAGKLLRFGAPGEFSHKGGKKMLDLAGRINGADAGSLEGLRSLDADGQLSNTLSASAATMRQMLKSGDTEMVTSNGVVKLTEDLIKTMEAAVAKLRGGDASTVQTMIVREMKVEKSEEAK